MNSKTIMTGVFGYPIEQSLSPIMHNQAFRALGINFSYAAFAVAPDQLEQAVNGIRALGFAGVNVTIPHKVAIIPFLDEIDQEAEEIGAVNTIVNDGGKLIGFNTDGAGYVQSLLEEWKVPLTGKRVIILGAGGAAKGVAVSLAKRGVASICVVNRSVEKAEALAKQISHFTHSVSLSSDHLKAKDVEQVDLIINTTSVGMYPYEDNIPIDPSFLHPKLVVSDLIYNPLETKLLQEAKKIGARTHGGVGMFIHQGALAQQKWTGKQPPISLMKQTVLDQLQSKSSE
ncbi:shikimate dehydrogenase [Ammoniphilus resinae]|uniref:Shikimate dehydrogenase (NADP(+)) n=1 Tax=Ammoniphilus resinae TaxID=861532 RepID=A0ABS4GJR1_9BACL|nr:shikimate dehydrogenase [Ammoniphilus resinae]MBP1930481.1 shikimate dehydrogenase [Ammoniphilus resinae]